MKDQKLLDWIQSLNGAPSACYYAVMDMLVTRLNRKYGRKADKGLKPYPKKQPLTDTGVMDNLGMNPPPTTTSPTSPPPQSQEPEYKPFHGMSFSPGPSMFTDTPPDPWKDIPPEYKFMATNCDGRTWAYTEQPYVETNGGKWVPNSEHGKDMLIFKPLGVLLRRPELVKKTN